MALLQEGTEACVWAPWQAPGPGRGLHPAGHLRSPPPPAQLWEEGAGVAWPGAQRLQGGEQESGQGRGRQGFWLAWGHPHSLS